MTSLQFSDIHQEQQLSLSHKKRNYGTNLPLWLKSNGQPRLMLGPHYYVFFVAFIISIGLSYLIEKEVAQILTNFWFGLTLVSTFSFLASYLYIGFSLPGIASREEQPQQSIRNTLKYCVPCRIVRPEGTIHCYDCDVCITQYDHHCPWVGKCVGKGNICAFYTFLTLTFGNLLFFLVAAIFGHK